MSIIDSSMNLFSKATVGIAISLIAISNLLSAPKPNIVIMMADDMGMGDSSAYQFFTQNADEQQLHTPAMEKLARMGVTFTDAHTPSSRCTPTRYSLLTGRYSWRNRIKVFVLFGSQGDPMIEPDRPTIASLLSGEGYRTGIVGKWHVGLRYTRSDGLPAQGWKDADLMMPLTDGPLDHGFDFARFTSRSHGTSGPNIRSPKNKRNPNTPKQSIGPGHLHGRHAIAATTHGKQLKEDEGLAYVLTELGSRHSDSVISFLSKHTKGNNASDEPFFLYYPVNSNHGPYTPDESINGVAVAGAAQSKAGKYMNVRSDFIYENDVALDRLMTFLEENDDPRNPGHKLIENTLIIFTSDNGAEKNFKYATGPFRSNKASCYEGGHRVPFIASWPLGGVGNGDSSSKGEVSRALIGLQDIYATLSEIIERPLPDLTRGLKGAEDSQSFLKALKGFPSSRAFALYNDHKECKEDAAVLALRMNNPMVGPQRFDGEWKIFFKPDLLRQGKAQAYELYNLASDPQEKDNLVDRSDLKKLIQMSSQFVESIRHSGSERYALKSNHPRHVINFQNDITPYLQSKGDKKTKHINVAGVNIKFTGWESMESSQTHHQLSQIQDGLSFGVPSEKPSRWNGGEFLHIQFDKDVVINYLAIKAGSQGRCGGFYQVGNSDPLAIYCVDQDNDSDDQSGILGDIGYLPAGTILKVSSQPHWYTEPGGEWVLQSLSFSKVN